LALTKQGHQVAVYSNLLGEVAEEIDSLGIPVLSDVSDAPFMPEIIHGHHHLEAMTAILQFPEVPAIYLCHGFAPWQERPPIHPRIIEYGAVDEPTRRYCIKNGVPAQKIRLILNFVDLDRFKPRGPLPVVPQRALVFSNHTSGNNCLASVRAACQRAGLELDVRGYDSGKPERSPETLLGNYDVVFAKARCALEAMAVGTAVVLCDAGGLGPMVSSDLLDVLRLRNFGSTTLKLSHSPEVLLEQINRYNADDAALVSMRIRSEASLDITLPSIVGLYREAIVQFSKSRPDPQKESLALSVYVRQVSDIIKINAAEEDPFNRRFETLWNSWSWRLFRPIRNFIRRCRRLPPESKPEINSIYEALEAIKSIKNSATWHITRPLRTLRKLVERCFPS
jgi:hypothetical protein